MKERIIGAAVLVLIVVLVVPVFLDGPPEDAEIVSERVLLPGQEGQAAQTVVLERDRSEPVPAASSQDRKATPSVAKPTPSPRQEQPAPRPQVAQTPTKTEPVRDDAQTPKAAPPPVSSTGMWAVQLGSFANKDNAEKLASDLRKQGYAAFLSQLASNGGQLHRVRIGPQKDRDSAEETAARLKKAGHDGQVVPHP
ncbi:MAG: SPOR domain-containing protein [Gammaproteobacteria bacterium]|nr:SPOR domain-containing protein [Gammaproteobacteria bacterium]